MAEQPPTPATGQQPEEDRPHKPADDREEVYFDGAPLLRADIGRLLFWGIVGLVLMFSPFLWDLIFKNHHSHIGVKIGLIVVGLFVLVLPILIIRTTRYRISNYRIDYERGILSKRVDTIELWHVEDISLTQSLLDRILKTGTIVVVSHDETTPRLEIEGVPNPRPLFETIKQRIISVKRQRGVIKMDIG